MEVTVTSESRVQQTYCTLERVTQTRDTEVEGIWGAGPQMLH